MKKHGLRMLRLCLILGLLLVLSLSVSATEITDGDPSPSGGTDIHATTTVTAYPEFTVTIPTGIPLGTLTRTPETSYHSATFDVSVQEISSLGDCRIEVSVSTPDGRFCLKNGAYELPYALYDAAEGGTQLGADGDVFAVFEKNGTATGRIVVDQSQISAAGVYTGTLTFTVSILDGEES